MFIDTAWLFAVVEDTAAVAEGTMIALVTMIAAR